MVPKWWNFSDFSSCTTSSFTMRSTFFGFQWYPNTYCIDNHEIWCRHSFFSQDESLWCSPNFSYIAVIKSICPILQFPTKTNDIPRFKRGWSTLIDLQPLILKTDQCRHCVFIKVKIDKDIRHKIHKSAYNGCNCAVCMVCKCIGSFEVIHVNVWSLSSFDTFGKICRHFLCDTRNSTWTALLTSTVLVAHKTSLQCITSHCCIILH